MLTPNLNHRKLSVGETLHMSYYADGEYACSHEGEITSIDATGITVLVSYIEGDTTETQLQKANHVGLLNESGDHDVYVLHKPTKQSNASLHRQAILGQVEAVRFDELPTAKLEAVLDSLRAPIAA